MALIDQVFQSAPDKKIGRTGGDRDDAGGDAGFNPRPTKKSGEPTETCKATNIANAFQSAPDKKIGRTLGLRAQALSRQPVSIRARQKNRANRTLWSTTDEASTRFNPRPTKKSGEPRQGVTIRVTATVSIRARQKNRANPAPPSDRPRGRTVSIRARQKNRANHHDREAIAMHAAFQSAPDKKIGRTMRAWCTPPARARFNPRPTKKSGEPTGGRVAITSGWPFQSAPDKKIGRTSISCRYCSLRILFQSAPDKKIGRTIGRGFVLGAVQGVSIRARQKNRANLEVGDRRIVDARVSIRARQKNRANPRGSFAIMRQNLVSIRARQKNRANRPRRFGVAAGQLFQSAPDKKIGRTDTAPLLGRARNPFQSAPDKKIGRTPSRT